MDVGGANGAKWCILRTGGQRTLALAASLIAAGIDAWTPAQVVTKRRSRSRERLEITQAIMPTFVFVRAAYLPAIIDALAAPLCPHPPFSLFRHSGRIPLVDDGEISGARELEARAHSATEARRRSEAGREKRDVKDAMRRVVPVGERVSIPSGAFAGMSGIVDGGDRRNAWVNFGGGFRMKVDTWLLPRSDVEAKQPEWASAA